jgi:hypothetical protein
LSIAKKNSTLAVQGCNYLAMVIDGSSALERTIRVRISCLHHSIVIFFCNYIALFKVISWVYTMQGLDLIDQIETDLLHPVLQQRRRMYEALTVLFVQCVQPIESFGLMLRDRAGQPIVGPLEQMVRAAVLPDGGVTPTLMNPLLYKLIGNPQLLQRCRDQLLARQAIRCINQSIHRLVELHELRRIFLNRDDLQQLSALYALMEYSALSSAFDIQPLNRLFHQPHPELVHSTERQAQALLA